MTLARFSIDESPHTMDGLLIHAFAGFQEVEAFISRNRHHPFVDVLTPDISESGARLDSKSLVRAPLPPFFVKMG